MKKIFAWITAVLMLLSMAACGNDAATDNTPKETAGDTQPVDKQALYEDFFTDANFKTAGDSMKLNSEVMNVSVVQDQNENTMVEFGILENYMKIYVLQDGKQYVNIKIGEEDGWGEYKGENALDTAGVDMSAYDTDLEGILRVEYVETKDGVDIVKLYKENPEYNENATITEYKLSFQYDGKDCEITVTVEEDGEGGEMTDYNTDQMPEDFDIFSYTIDYENKMLLNDWDESEKIPFEITGEKELSVDTEICFEVCIDAATQAVTSMQQMYDGELVTVEFFDVESCLEGVEIPEDVEELSDEELGLALLGLIFSAADLGAE